MIAKSFSHDLAGILDGKFDFQILVPVRIRFQLTFPNPLGVILINILNFEVVRDVEFFQSGPDCKGDMASLRVEVCLTLQGVRLCRLPPHQFFPVLVIG